MNRLSSQREYNPLGDNIPGEMELARRQCDFYLESLKQLYDARIVYLREYLENAIGRIKNDQVLLVMKGDPTLEGFVANRVQEIINNSAATEREMEIHNLMQDLAMARSEKVATENEIHKLSLKVLELERQENEVAQRWELEQSNLRKKDEEHEALKEELMRITELKKSIEGRIRDTEAKYEDELYANSNQIKDLNHQLDILKHELKDTYNKLQIANKEKNEKVYQYVQSVERLEANNKELNFKLREAEQLLAKKQEEAIQMKHHNEQFNDVIRSYEEKLLIANRELDKVLSEKNSTAQKYNADANRFKEIIETEKRHYEDTIGELQRSNAKLKEELSSTSKTANSLKVTYSQLEEANREYINEISALKKELSMTSIEADRKITKIKKDHEITIDSFRSEHKEEEVINSITSIE
jgi:chromosome segregation ATPase